MTTIAGKPLCKLVQLLSAIMFMGVVAGANATVIATDDGFEARYTVRLDSTLTGNDIKNVAIFERMIQVIAAYLTLTQLPVVEELISCIPPALPQLLPWCLVILMR